MYSTAIIIIYYDPFPFRYNASSQCCFVFILHMTPNKTLLVVSSLPYLYSSVLTIQNLLYFLILFCHPFCYRSYLSIITLPFFVISFPILPPLYAGLPSFIIHSSMQPSSLLFSFVFTFPLHPSLMTPSFILSFPLSSISHDSFLHLNVPSLVHLSSVLPCIFPSLLRP